jgi:hypothetical protein
MRDRSGNKVAVMASGTLTDLQLAVMKALWEIGEGTVGDVLAALLNSFFGGRASALTAQLLESDEISPEDLREMPHRAGAFILFMLRLIFFKCDLTK